MLYFLIVFFGVVGNGFVIIIVCKMLLMYIIINYLLMNLVVVDLLMLLFCFGLYDYILFRVYLEGFWGDLICKLFVGNVIVLIIINVVVLIVCMIVVERYLVLLKFFCFNLRIIEGKVKYVIGVLWFFVLLLCILDI